jgi:hypothetical protein
MIDKKCAKTRSNDDSKHPHDPDAKIAETKGGRRHLAHKAEHVVGQDTGALLAVFGQDATIGDSVSLQATVATTATTVTAPAPDETRNPAITPRAIIAKWVANKRLPLQRDQVCACVL